MFSSLGFSREEASLDWDKYIPLPRSIELMLFSRHPLLPLFRSPLSGKYLFLALRSPSVSLTSSPLFPVATDITVIYRWTVSSFFTDRITYVYERVAGPTTRGIPGRNDFLKNQPRGCLVSTLGYYEKRLMEKHWIDFAFTRNSAYFSFTFDGFDS